MTEGFVSRSSWPQSRERTRRPVWSREPPEIVESNKKYFASSAKGGWGSTTGGIIKGNYNKVVLLYDVGAVIWRRESPRDEKNVGSVEEGRIERLSQFARKTNWNFNRPPYPTALNASATLLALTPSLPFSRARPSLTSVLLFPPIPLFFSSSRSAQSES